MFFLCISLIKLAEGYFGLCFICDFGPGNMNPDNDDDYDNKEEEEE